MRTTLLSICIVLAFTLQGQTPFSLEQCVDIAVENNLDVQRSKLSLENAETDLKESRLSRYPTANASANYGVSWGRSIDPVTNAFVTQRINSFRPNLNSGVTLFNAFQINNTIKGNEKEVTASELDVQRSVNDVSLNVVTFFLNVLLNKELLENAKFQLESSKEQLLRTEKLVESGALPITNKLELISQVSTNEVNVVNAENNLSLALLNLKQAMLLPADQPLEIEEPEVDAEEPDLDISSSEVYQVAEGSLPEIQAADLRVRSAELNLQAAKALRYPSISVNAGLGSNFSSAVKDFDPTLDGTEFTFQEQIEENFNQFVSINLNIPIFNGLQAQANVQRSKIAMRQADINAQEQRNFLRQTIESAYNDALAASKSYAAAQRQVEALEETFRSVKNQYNLGAANFTDYQVAENNLFQARTDLTRAKYDFVFRKKLLDFYQGKPIF
jgi:outer membrane protein